MSPAVGVGDVLKQAKAVQNAILYLLIVGQDVHPGQPKSGGKALEIRVGLPFLLRLDVNLVGAVHTPRADAHDHALVSLQNLPEVNVPEERVLGGHMASGEDDKITLCHQRLRLIGVGAVQNGVAAEIHALITEGGNHVRAELAG